jgi:hypothetical protein
MAMSQWQNTIRAVWSNRISLGKTGEIPCSLTFEATFVDGNDAHHNVVVSAGSGRANAGRWFITSAGSTAADEFGHLFGLADEYRDAACPDRSPVNTGTVMDNNSANVNRSYFSRFAVGIDSNLL